MKYRTYPASKIQITRTISTPDHVKLERYKRLPSLGPQVLFFCGGSALRKLSQKLINYTHNSIHLITPFDSGGSSAVIRKHFNMLAVGDLRNRLMALADDSILGNPEVFKLFATRLPKNEKQAVLKETIRSMIGADHPLVRKIPDPMRKIIRNHLNYFYQEISGDFDLSGASIGNLILAGGYMNNGNHIDPVLFTFTKLVEARGIVRTITNEDLHLVAVLENGEKITGQHRFSGKESDGVKSPIRDVYLIEGNNPDDKRDVILRDKVGVLIDQAELICYPMGSFFSSVLSHFLVKGVSDRIAKNDCPKVYIPNMGKDPEQFGISTADSVKLLLSFLHKHLRCKATVNKLLNIIVIDSQCGNYENLGNINEIEKLGVIIIDTNLVSKKSYPYIDEMKLLEILLSIT